MFAQPAAAKAKQAVAAASRSERITATRTRIRARVAENDGRSVTVALRTSNGTRLGRGERCKGCSASEHITSRTPDKKPTLMANQQEEAAIGC